MREDVREFLENAWGKPIGLDTETNGEDVRSLGFATGVSIAFRHHGYVWSHYFPFRNAGDHPDNYSQEERNALKLLVENAPKIYMHNAKFDISSMMTLGIDIQNSNWYCSMVISSLINENYPYNRSLDNLSKIFLKREKEKSEELTHWITVMGWGGVPPEVMRKYAAVDAELALLLGEYMEEQGEVTYPGKFLEIWEWKRAFINVVRNMEIQGVSINQEYCHMMEDKGRARMQEIEDWFGINLASEKELSELLHDQWKLPPLFVEEKPKETGATLEKKIASNHKNIEKWEKRFNVVLPRHTDKVVKLSLDKNSILEYKKMLPTLSRDLPREFPDLILEYRGWAKSSSSYFSAYLREVQMDGKLRPNYMHHKSDEGGTVTGRLSCKDPNLQQIPREPDADEGDLLPWRKVKPAFKPSPGFKLFEVDYSQLELRLLTAYANVPSLVEVFKRGEDLFTVMSQEMGFPRQVIKKFVYMTNYGAGPKKISVDIEIPLSEALQIKDAYYSTYPEFQQLAKACANQVETTGKLNLWTHRARRFRNRGESYKAMNSLIQGGSADVVERVMVRLWHKVVLNSNGEVRMLLTVHDSVWFEIKENTEHKWLPIIQEIMSDIKSIGIDTEVVFATDYKELKTA